MRQIETVSFPSLEYTEDIYHKVHAYFDIPYDNGEGRQLKFDIEEFCRHFKLQRQTAYYAVKYIERTGHWTLSEDVDISTKIQILTGRNDLYDLDFEESAMPLLLETLMRKYTGIFSYAVPIDEDYMASCVRVTVPQLRQLLYKLSLEHVIRYIPNDHATVLFLHHERLRPKNLNLDPERYRFLKDSAHVRTQKMMEYVMEDEVCRSAYLLDYFGQEDSADCGTCDICRSAGAARSMTAASEMEKELRSFIVDEMKGKYSVDDVSRRFCVATNSADYISLLRRLVDSGTVSPPENL